MEDGEIGICCACGVLFTHEATANRLRRLTESEWDGLPPASRAELTERRARVYDPAKMVFRGDWRCARPVKVLSSCKEVSV